MSFFLRALFLVSSSPYASTPTLGNRPLCLGKLMGTKSDVWVVASESCAFGPIGADFVREVSCNRGRFQLGVSHTREEKGITFFRSSCLGLTLPPDQPRRNCENRRQWSKLHRYSGEDLPARRPRSPRGCRCAWWRSGACVTCTCCGGGRGSKAHLCIFPAVLCIVRRRADPRLPSLRRSAYLNMSTFPGQIR